jgi:Immunity protein 27
MLPMTNATVLEELWVFEDGEMVARGDSAAIGELIATKLIKVRTEEDGWTVIYQHRETHQLWELSFPYSHLHGGGPRRLRPLG